MKKTRTTVGLIVCNEEAYKRNTAWRRISSDETAAPDRTAGWMAGLYGGINGRSGSRSRHQTHEYITILDDSRVQLNATIAALKDDGRTDQLKER